MVEISIIWGQKSAEQSNWLRLLSKIYALLTKCYTELIY